jgi:hypothetical protein
MVWKRPSAACGRYRSTACRTGGTRPAEVAALIAGSPVPGPAMDAARAFVAGYEPPRTASVLGHSDPMLWLHTLVSVGRPADLVDRQADRVLRLMG